MKISKKKIEKIILESFKKYNKKLDSDLINDPIETYEDDELVDINIEAMRHLKDMGFDIEKPRHVKGGTVYASIELLNKENWNMLFSVQIDPENMTMKGKNTKMIWRFALEVPFDTALGYADEDIRGFAPADILGISLSNSSEAAAILDCIDQAIYNIENNLSRHEIDELAPSRMNRNLLAFLLGMKSKEEARIFDK